MSQKTVFLAMVVQGLPLKPFSDYLLEALIPSKNAFSYGESHNLTEITLIEIV